MLKQKITTLLVILLLGTALGSIRIEEAAATSKITNGQACKKGSQSIVLGALLFRCVGKGKSRVWNSFVLSATSSIISSPPSRANIPTSPFIPTAGADPHLECDGSGELMGAHPGWSSEKAIKLTLVDDSIFRRAFFWCPAAAPSANGTISYTITSKLGAVTCETTQTFCELEGVPTGTAFEIMATDESGSYPLPTFAIQNTGTPVLCNTAANFCNPGPGNLIFPSYGNMAPVGIGDCTFAAVANWEEIVLGTTPNTSLILNEFADAGGTSNLGLTNSQVFNYWRTHGIGGTYLNSELPFYADPVHLKMAIDDPGVRAVIASLNLAKGQSFAGTTMPEASYHWVVVDGYTPQGPLVATWGKTLQMTWQQWSSEIVSMWGITTRS